MKNNLLIKRNFKAIESKYFKKSDTNIEKDKVYSLSELDGVISNSSILKYFREVDNEMSKMRVVATPQEQYPKIKLKTKTVILRERYFKGKKKIWKDVKYD